MQRYAQSNGLKEQLRLILILMFLFLLPADLKPLTVGCKTFLSFLNTYIRHQCWSREENQKSLYLIAFGFLHSHSLFKSQACLI